MKRDRMMLLLFALLLTAIPVVPALLLSHKTPPATSESSATTESLPDFSVLDVSTGEVLTVSARDYVIGAVCAEMPATFEPEALKAQAVAAHTYAVRQQQIEQENPTADLCGADFSRPHNIRHTSQRIRQSSITVSSLTPIIMRLPMRWMLYFPIF